MEYDVENVVKDIFKIGRWYIVANLIWLAVIILFVIISNGR